MEYIGIAVLVWVCYEVFAAIANGLWEMFS